MAQISEYNYRPFGIDIQSLTRSVTSGNVPTGILYRQKIQDPNPQDPAAVPTINHVEVYKIEGIFEQKTAVVFGKQVQSAQITIIGPSTVGLRTLDHGTFEQILSKAWASGQFSTGFGSDIINIGGSSETGVVPIDNVPELNDVVIFDQSKTRYPLSRLIEANPTGALFIWETEAGG